MVVKVDKSEEFVKNGKKLISEYPVIRVKPSKLKKSMKSEQILKIYIQVTKKIENHSILQKEPIITYIHTDEKREKCPYGHSFTC